MTNSFLRVELKFCECCGGLWLRDETANGVYCHHCAPQMLEVARGRKRGPKKRPQFEKVYGYSGGVLWA